MKQIKFINNLYFSQKSQIPQVLYSYILYNNMPTTIQIQDNTLLLLKRLKAHLEASSYDEAITQVANKEVMPKISMAGSLKKYLRKGETVEQMLKEMQNERRKEWR